MKSVNAEFELMGFDTRTVVKKIEEFVEASRATNSFINGSSKLNYYAKENELTRLEGFSLQFKLADDPDFEIKMDNKYQVMVVNQLLEIVEMSPNTGDDILELMRLMKLT